jgi:hypothetical protein
MDPPVIHRFIQRGAKLALERAQRVIHFNNELVECCVDAVLGLASGAATSTATNMQGISDGPASIEAIAQGLR